MSHKHSYLVPHYTMLLPIVKLPVQFARGCPFIVNLQALDVSPRA